MTTGPTIAARLRCPPIRGLVLVGALAASVSCGPADDESAPPFSGPVSVSTDDAPVTGTDSPFSAAPDPTDEASTSSMGSSTTASSPGAELASVGECSTADTTGSGGGSVEVVSCTSPDARSKISAVVADESECAAAYLTFSETSDVFCLEAFVSDGSAEFAALQSVDALLTAQSNALLSGDHEAFGATLGPDVDDSLRSAADNTGVLPLSSVDVAIASGERIGEAAAGEGEIDGLGVEITFQFDDVDDNPFTYRADYDLFDAGGGDYLVGDVDFADDPPFWFDDRLVVEETEHFYGLALESSGGLAQLMTEAEEAYAAIVATPLPIVDTSLIYLTDTQADFDDLTGRGPRTLGLAASYYQLDGAEFSASNRIAYINGEAFVKNEGDADRPATIRHELVHLMLSETARPFTPAWLTEGIATYYAGQLTDDTRAALAADPAYREISLDDLTSADQLGENDFVGERVGAEYLFSGEVVASLVDRFGDDAVIAFHDSFAEVDLTPVVDELPRSGTNVALDTALDDLTVRVTPELLQDRFGLDLATLESEVRARIG